MGNFQTNGNPFVVTDFAVYTDGLVAAAERSEWADAFLDDVTSWVKKEFGFREISSGIRKLYSSTIIVDFDTSPATLVRHLKEIADFISDRAVPGPATPPKFTIERRAGVSFGQERYFSAAPMKTAHHVEALEKIERISAGA
jgi:hypothetical protein